MSDFLGHMTDRARQVVSDRIKPGDAVRVRDIHDAWLDREAATSVLQGYKFPVVFVRKEGGEPVAWPAEDVELIEASGGGPSADPTE